MNKVEKLLKMREIVFLDGAMGTMLQKSGMPTGIKSDVMNIARPHIVEAVHRAYVEAGSDIICTNTFGASSLALKDTGYTPARIIEAALTLAKNAAGENALVAFDMGPIGELLEPSGELTYESAYEMFREQAVIAEACGADLAVIETMSDISELRAALSATRDAVSLPVFASMTFRENGKTYMGAAPSELAAAAFEYGAMCVGINCSVLPEKMLSVARELAAATDLPIILKLNAGMPDSSGSYAVTPEEYAASLLPYRELGVRVLGACCGSTPDFIKELVRVFRAD